MTAERLAFLNTIARVMDDSVVLACGGIFLLSREESEAHLGPLVAANCNDIFHWACAEMEEITPENLPVFLQACADAKAAGDEGECTGLFAARVRGMRPQGAVYRTVTPAMAELYDACGPERTDQDGAASRAPRQSHNAPNVPIVPTEPLKVSHG